jgi:hypothetical protein
MSVLPDNVLLEIFDFYRKNHPYTRYGVWEWHLLVHVCRRWRQIVFASLHCLNLQLLCTFGTPVRNLGIWPAFPIVMDYHSFPDRGLTPHDEDNVIAALKHLDRVRVCDVRFAATGSQLGKMATVLQEPFPMLTDLSIDIKTNVGNVPVLPANFLGGSALYLQKVTLFGIPYPALPMLLLSASNLVTLSLRSIPPTGYISPEAMVVGLAALPRLETFTIGFQSATSRPDQIPPPPVTRVVLPALTFFEFHGASKYLEDLVARINSSQLNHISIRKTVLC